MTNQQARALLRRKKLKGEEVGRALLLSFVTDYEQRDSGHAKALFTQQELGQMVAALPSEHERRIYAGFVSLYDDLDAMFAKAQGLLQQLQHGLFRMQARVEKLHLRARLMALVTPLAEHTLDPEVAALPERVDALFIEEPSAGDQAELLAARDQLVLPAFRQLQAYNAVLDALAGGMDIPELRVLKISLEVVRFGAKTYDTLIVAHPSVLPEVERDALPTLSLPDDAACAARAREFAETLRQHGAGWFHLGEVWREFADTQEVQ